MDAPLFKPGIDLIPQVAILEFTPLVPSIDFYKLRPTITFDAFELE